VGKYVELKDAYYSVREALFHAGMYYDRQINLQWVQSEELQYDNSKMMLRSAQGIIVPGGFGYRGIEGMIVAANYARTNNIPYLGLCLGMQVMAIEFCRYALVDNKANSTEFDPETTCPIIDLMPDQQNVDNMGGTMRLGAYPCKLVAGTHAASVYEKDVVYERHRHRYEFNNHYRELLEPKGFVCSGLSLDKKLVEIAEIKDHPWMVACQFHAEFKSRPNRPHPLFLGFIEAARKTLADGIQVTLPL
jgi:CTP synthase